MFLVLNRCAVWIKILHYFLANVDYYNYLMQLVTSCTQQHRSETFYQVQALHRSGGRHKQTRNCLLNCCAKN